MSLEACKRGALYLHEPDNTDRVIIVTPLVLAHNIGVLLIHELLGTGRTSVSDLDRTPKPS